MGSRINLSFNSFRLMAGILTKSVIGQNISTAAVSKKKKPEKHYRLVEVFK